MCEDFLTQLILLLVEWYLNRKASNAKQKNSPTVVVMGDVYFISNEDGED